MEGSCLSLTTGKQILKGQTPGPPYSWLYPQYVEQCMGHGRHSIASNKKKKQVSFPLLTLWPPRPSPTWGSVNTQDGSDSRISNSHPLEHTCFSPLRGPQVLVPLHPLSISPAVLSCLLPMLSPALWFLRSVSFPSAYSTNQQPQRWKHRRQKSRVFEI